MKHLNKALATGIFAALLSGGVAAAAFVPTALDPLFAATATRDAAPAADHGPFGGPDLFAAAAAYIGITADALRTELASGKSLAEVAIAHGKTRDGLIAALNAASAAANAKLVDQKGTPPGPGRGPGGPGGPGHFGFAPGVAGDPFAAAATYLGISATDLRTKLSGGQSLAAVATATAGKSRDGLIKALVADETARIDQAQKDGKITADQATHLKSGITDRVTRLVDSTRPAPGPHR